MGDRLVRKVETELWPHLPNHPARIVLSAMARQAMDADENPAYFAGWEPLARALGYPQPEGNEAARRAVGRAVDDLRRAGHIRQDRSRSRSWKRRWQLLTVKT